MDLGLMLFIKIATIKGQLLVFLNQKWEEFLVDIQIYHGHKNKDSKKELVIHLYFH